MDYVGHKPEDHSLFVVSELETHYMDRFAFEFLQLLNVSLKNEQIGVSLFPVNH